MLDAIKDIAHGKFSFRKTVHTAQVHYACNIVQLSEKCDFRVFLFWHVVEKHKLFEVA